MVKTKQLSNNHIFERLMILKFLVFVLGNMKLKQNYVSKIQHYQRKIAYVVHHCVHANQKSTRFPLQNNIKPTFLFVPYVGTIYFSFFYKFSLALSH